MEERINRTVETTFEGVRLDQCLAEMLQYSRSYIQKLIKENKVCVNGNFVTKAKVPVHVGDEISILVPPPEELSIQPENIPLDILYEDRELLVVNKPKGMVVHPSAGHMEHTLVNALLYHCRGELSGINGVLRPGIVHRIDKDTTGALIICKTDRAHQVIAEQLSVHSVTRKYQAVVYNNFPEDTGTIDLPIARHPVQRKKMAVAGATGGKRAVTHFRVLDRLNHQFNYIECQLETGRTHQIRVHMSHIRHPILGDTVYGPQPPKRFAGLLQGQTLHAGVIGFTHPATGQYIELEAPLPSYFVKLLEILS